MASRHRLQEVLKMWGSVLGRRVDAVSKDTREQVEIQLRSPERRTDWRKQPTSR